MLRQFQGGWRHVHRQCCRRILSEDRDIEPEVIESLVSPKPDTCAGRSNHHGIKEHHRDHDIKQVHHNLHHRQRMVDVNQSPSQQSGRQQQLAEHREADSFQRNQKLSIHWLGQCEVELSGADVFTERQRSSAKKASTIELISIPVAMNAKYSCFDHS